MKHSMTNMLAAFAFATLIVGETAYAQTPVPDVQNHEAHHPKGQAAAKTTGMPMEGGMMESMKMDDMQSMMHECMEAHKDGKMCEHQTMEKCEANMKKGECKKMMKQCMASEKKEKAKK